MHSQETIIQLTTGSYQVNTYIVYCNTTNEGIIIDPGGDTDKILDTVREKNIIVKYILNTHGHADHILVNEELKKSLNVPVAMHAEDASFFIRQDIQEKSSRELGLSVTGRADIRLEDEETLRIGNLEIRVIHTPGHTPGSVCFLINGNLFTGDTLFVGDVGRTDLTGGSFEQLLQSIKNKILTLPPGTRVWPGHNYGEMPTSTLAWEMKENPYITDFILAEE